MNLRNLLLEKLESYQTEYPAESATVDRFTHLIESYERCAYRDCFPSHLTGSGWLVTASGDKVLLTHHAKLNLWLQLGGHADGDMDLERVARREVMEESGLERFQVCSPHILDLDIHRIPSRGEEPEHFHYDARYAFQMLDDVGEYRISSESHDLQWVHMKELESYTRETSMLRMRDKWLAQFACRD
jgi:8-oxo-dGTP pyrophosphatase MutT (NUDIX family)